MAPDRVLGRNIPVYRPTKYTRPSANNMQAPHLISPKVQTPWYGLEDLPAIANVDREPRDTASKC